MTKKVNIRPGVSVLSVLRHLNYEPWYALAEFVDNAIQSYVENYDDLVRVEGRRYKLRVQIILDANEDMITIRDNAAGIPMADYPRAFKTAAPPKNRKGLSEFGMGMKSAACWFAPEWQVRTTALGELEEGTIAFNIESIVQNELEDVAVRVRRVGGATHYTEVILKNVHKMPQARTITKIKDHLASIYREFIRRGAAEIKLGDQILAYEPPRILLAPYYRRPDEDAREWRRDLDIQLDDAHRIHGFAAIREKASTSQAGFALFRRSRVIQGSADQGYRPPYVFGQANSFTYQRLFGELHFEGFEVSHTKDGFRWDEYEDEFLKRLRADLSTKEMPILDQAEGHRVRPPKADVQKLAQTVLETTEKLVTEYLPQAAEQFENNPAGSIPPSKLAESALIATRAFDVDLDFEKWRLSVELTTEGAMGNWYEIAEYLPNAPKNAGYDRSLKARLSLAHPFTLRFAQTDNSHLEPMTRLALALCIAESQARAGAGKVGSVRIYLNQLLRDIFAKV